MTASILTAAPNDGVTTRGDATDSEVARYLEAGGLAKIGIRTAIALLRAKQAQTSDPVESRQITVQLLELESAVSRIQADLIAFSSEQSSIRPPSEQQVSRIKDVARSIDAFVAESELATTIFAAATTLIQTFATTRA